MTLSTARHPPNSVELLYVGEKSPAGVCACIKQAKTLTLEILESKCKAYNPRITVSRHRQATSRALDTKSNCEGSGYYCTASLDMDNERQSTDFPIGKFCPGLPLEIEYHEYR
nr:hypothetical protein CFP56_07757 [Quercus suber]